MIGTHGHVVPRPDGKRARCGGPGDDDNLAAMCQACHLAYDAEHHAETAATSRAARLADGGQLAFEVIA